MIGKNISHYKIIEKLGEGGMGIVYKAEDTNLKREVAIKFLPHRAAWQNEEQERFKVEARAAAALNHPNIATIHSIEEIDNEVFIVMEYINGVELKEKVMSGPIKLSDTIEIVTKIAAGLKTAHNKGIIHRDIKSSNVMITGEDQVKIMDFGLAKVKGNGLVTRMDTVVGTAAYMSPEQISGEKVDHRSDIWSLGIIFYELLTGELPFKADYDAAWTYTILNSDPLKPSELDRKIPVQLDLIVMKMLEKDRDKRYTNIEKFLEDLKEAQREIGAIEQEVKTKAIAVLPFKNISAEKESDYFSDGLAEELIMNLSRLKNMRVVSRTTSMQYKGVQKSIKAIGKELGVRYIIEGSVRKFQDNLRITAQLIEVERDAQLWAETYKGNLADVFDIQEKVSKQIVDALTITLSPTEKKLLKKKPTENLLAYDFYLKARDFLNRGTKNNIEYSIQLFQKCVGLDNRFANAYAGLGEAYASIYNKFERKNEWLDKAIEYSLKAITYDSHSAEAYAALALSYYGKKLYDEAFIAGEKAIELDENSIISYWVLAGIYVTRDKNNEAIPLYKKIIELNPDFCFAYTDLRHCYMVTGQKEKASEILKLSLPVFERYLAIHPDDARAYMYYCDDLINAGKIEEGKKQASKAIDLNPNDPVMQFNAACFYSLINENNLAVEALKKAIENGFQDYEWIKHDIALENIRNHPGYLSLIKDYS